MSLRRAIIADALLVSFQDMAVIWGLRGTAAGEGGTMGSEAEGKARLAGLVGGGRSKRVAIGQDADQNQAEMHGGLHAIGSANSCLRVAVKGEWYTWYGRGGQAGQIT